MNDSLSRSIYYSIAAHMGLASLFFLQMTFLPTAPIEIKRAIRVDLVALPDKISTPPLPVTEAPKPVEVPPPAQKAVEAPKAAPPEAPTVPTKKADAKKIERSQESAMNRLKALEALEKIKQETATENAKAQEVIKGNAVSKGNSLTGLEQIDYDRYFDEVEQLLYAQWVLPEWLVNAGLRAQALVLVDKTGHIIKKEILKSSGNPTFDAHVITAIEKASPFPQPPARLQGVLANQGFVFNFPD